MGNLEGGLLAGVFERKVLGTERLFLWGSEKGTWRGSPFLGNLEDIQRGLWRRKIFLYVGVP
jgi:hypothetical protein